MNIANLRARTFAIFYVLTIPLFAIVYTLDTGGFYHSTVTLEDGYFDDRRDLAEMLKAKIVRDFESHHGSTKIKLDDVRTFDVQRHIWVKHFKYSDDGPYETLNFRVAFSWSYAEETDIGLLRGSGPGGQYYPVELHGLVLFGVDDSLDIRADSYNFRVTVGPAALGPSLLAPDILFPNISEDGDLAFPLTLAEGSVISAHRNHHKGTPSLSWDLFFRMLYLSAVTVTTLGYGDIVPISNTARMAVACQSVLGILLMGFFVNAAFRERL